MGKDSFSEIKIESLVNYNQFGVIERAQQLIESSIIIDFDSVEKVKKVNFPRISNAQILEYNDYIYIIGGLAKEKYYINDELIDNPYSSSILRSKDMVNWEIIKSSLVGIGNLSQHRCCIFKNEIYLIFENSVYKSSNGIYFS